MEEDGRESVGSGAADMSAMGVDAGAGAGAGIGVCVGASDDSIEVSSTSHADLTAVSLYRGTFNIDDADGSTFSLAATRTRPSEALSHTSHGLSLNLN